MTDQWARWLRQHNRQQGKGDEEEKERRRRRERLASSLPPLLLGAPHPKFNMIYYFVLYI